MTRMRIDIDELALAQAAQAHGTTNPSDTINAALTEAVACHRRTRLSDLAVDVDIAAVAAHDQAL